jgi:transposase
MHSLEYRQAVINAYMFFGSMRSVSKALKVSVASISRWSKRIKPSGWPCRASKLTQVMQLFMFTFLADHPSTTAIELRRYIMQQFGVVVSRQLVSLVLRKRMNMSWKRTRKRGPRTNPSALARKRQFQEEFMKAYSSGTLACVDESGFDQRARPVYGYAPRGKQAIITIQPNSHRHVHYSLLATMHMNGQLHSQIVESSVDANCFANFIDSTSFDAGTVLILDNASIHRNETVRKAAERKGIQLLFTPPYHPEYNPIELVFGVAKTTFYKQLYKSNSTDQNMVGLITQSFVPATRPSNIQNYFRHVHKRVQNDRASLT